jgi:hypothetical protein
MLRVRENHAARDYTLVYDGIAARVNLAGRPRIVAKVKIPFSYESAILGYLTAGLPLP